MECPYCNGTGIIGGGPHTGDCAECGGTGVYRDGAETVIKGGRVLTRYTKPTECDECNYMIRHEDEDKWSEPIACGACGRTKEDLIKLQAEYDGQWAEWRNR